MPARRQRLLIVNINLSPRTLEGCRAIAAELDAIAAEQGLKLDTSIAHWRSIDASTVKKRRPGAVVLGPNETPFPAYPAEFDAFLGWVRRRRGPTLGICGGHQALALAHGAPIGPVHAVPAARESYAGMPKVSGPTGVRLLGEWDPLLDDLPLELRLHASHVDEVKDIPEGFRLLAIGDPCHVQMIKADRRPLYGVQCHPERAVEDDGGAGRRLLANFLALAFGPTR